jgi:hypothetical protein
LETDGAAAVDGAAALREDQLAPVVAAAIARIPEIEGGAAATALGHVTYAVADLPADELGRMVGGSRIEIDIDAAGYGWFVDATPLDDSEFGRASPSPAAGRADLLTVVMHELGHVLGLGHDEAGVMQETLPLGARRPWDDVFELAAPGLGNQFGPEAVDAAFAG